MKEQLIKSISWMLTLVLLLSAFCIYVPAQAAETTVTDVQDGVTLHCWNWSFKEIEANMETIAALGYTAIQTSPIQRAKQPTDGYPSNDWWVYYQPADFMIDSSGDSALGTKKSFEKMCQTADKYGIKVIVDVVANHMGNGDTGSGLASTIMSDLKDDASCWHDITKNTSNYGSRLEVTQYCMAGLPDLNTSNKKVQNYVLDYLKECVDAGADGFRFDAVKHIETPEDGNIASDFWPTVIDGIKAYAPDVYLYGELLDSPGGNLKVDAYTKYMSVTDNTWSNNVLSSVIGGNAGAFSANYHKSSDASELVLWAESHDTFADGTTQKTDEAKINKAWALIAARADAMSLYLARPANMSQLLGAASDTGWSYPEVAAVNHFHNRFVGQSEYVANENGIAYVERGNGGVVLVNCKGGKTDVSVTANAIADGTYTDQITGSTFTVSGGKISGTVGDAGIAVVYDADPCEHKTHDADGFCTSCKANVGHTYDANNTCACGDKLIGERTIYFTNSGNWGTVNFYSWYDDINIISSAWPGDPMIKVEGDLYCCTVPADAPKIIFNDGTTQTEDLFIPSESGGKNCYDFNTGLWSTYSAEPEELPSDEDETKPTDVTEPTDSTEGNATENSGTNFSVSGILIIAIAAALLVGATVVVVIVKESIT